MRRIFADGLVIQFLTIWLVFTSRTVVADENEQISLDAIRIGTAKWRNSFINLRVIYDLHSLPALNEPLIDWPPLAELESAPRFAQEEWIWADHGLDLLDTHVYYWTLGQVGNRPVDVFNGPKNLSFRASYQKSAEGIEHLKSLEIRSAGGKKATSVKSRAIARGLYWPESAEWLPEKLLTREWKLEGIESICGDRCAKIAVEYPTRGDGTEVDILWLDLEHDFLPRRYQLPASSTHRGIDFVVDELQQLEGGLWFPRLARLQLQRDPNQNQLIVVTLAEINQPLDMTRFDPPPLETGTVVTDGRTGKVYSHGPESTPADRNHLESDGDPVSAVPPSPWGFAWPIAMACVSTVLLAIGLWFRRTELKE